jgi:hypothetical protein
MFTDHHSSATLRISSACCLVQTGAKALYLPSLRLLSSGLAVVGSDVPNIGQNTARIGNSPTIGCVREELSSFTASSHCRLEPISPILTKCAGRGFRSARHRSGAIKRLVRSRCSAGWRAGGPGATAHAASRTRVASALDRCQPLARSVRSASIHPAGAKALDSSGRRLARFAPKGASELPNTEIGCVGKALDRQMLRQVIAGEVGIRSDSGSIRDMAENWDWPPERR